MAEFFSAPLHSQKDYLEPTVDILNEEWPRSRTARKHMLEKSNDKFPYSLILLEKDDRDRPHVIGHSRLCQVHGQKDACFVESVVVCKSQRGRGFGRMLMQESEKHATRLGIKTIYLTTHDKQDFYGHIGYSYCEPVLSFGGASNLIPESLADSLFGKLTVTTCENRDEKPTQYAKGVDKATNSEISVKDSAKTGNNSSETKAVYSEAHCEVQVSSSTTADNSVSPPPSVPPAPLPPPPPPPPAAPAKDTKITKGDKVQRFGGKVYWMKKNVTES